MPDTPADAGGSGEEDAISADPELARTFWGLVVVFNAALLAASVGILVVVFSGDPRGYAVFAAGGVLFVAGHRRYRRVRDDDTGNQS